MRKRGRPPAGKEVAAARAEMQADHDRILELVKQALRNRDRLEDYVWLAATILNTLEKGRLWNRALAADAVSRLRRCKWGMGIDSGGSLSAHRFAQRFLETFAPNWNWRVQTDNGSADCRNERLIQQWAQYYRQENARRVRFVTPDEPDLLHLAKLRRVRSGDPTTWPTLRILKLATAFPERRLCKLVDASHPQPGEICVIAQRPIFQKRGGLPKRFGPRLVLAILEEFLRAAASQSRANNRHARLHTAAVKIKRALRSKLSRSGSTS